MQTRIGFVGLGTMGRPMALNLAQAGYDLRVYNRTRARMDPLVEEGARAASSYRDAADGAEVVIAMLSDSPVVRDVILGENGVLSGCAPGTIIVDMSTISPSVSREIAQQCEGRQVQFVDAPVSGGERGAIEGTLSIMVGGGAADVESVRPILEVLGSKITHMGAVGSGQAAKLCNQVVCGLNILAVCEGLALGSASGLDPKTLLEAIGSGAAGSWMLSNLAPKMVEQDWSPGFRIALQQKDLRLALESAAESKLPLTGTALAHQLFRAAEAGGYADEGTQSLVKVVKALGMLE